MTTPTTYTRRRWALEDELNRSATSDNFKVVQAQIQKRIDALPNKGVGGTSAISADQWKKTSPADRKLALDNAVQFTNPLIGVKPAATSSIASTSATPQSEWVEESADDTGGKQWRHRVTGEVTGVKPAEVSEQGYQNFWQNNQVGSVHANVNDQIESLIISGNDPLRAVQEGKISQADWAQYVADHPEQHRAGWNNTLTDAVRTAVFAGPAIAAGGMALGAFTPTGAAAATGTNLAAGGALAGGGAGFSTGGGLADLGITGAGGVDVLAGGSGADTLTTMPPAVPEADPTFGGELVETDPGVFTQPPVTPPTPTVTPPTPTVTPTPTPTPTSGGPDDVIPGGPDGGSVDLDAGGLAGLLGLTPELLQLLGIGGAAGLGIYGANQQADAFRDIANKEDARIREMMGFGAPYRTMLGDTFKPEWDVHSIKGFDESLDATTNSLLRGLSTKGNPWGNPGGTAEVMKYVTGNVALPTIQKHRDFLSGAGGLTAYAGGAASGPNLGPTMGAIGADAGVWNAAGWGLNQLTNPQPTLAQLLKQSGLV